MSKAVTAKGLNLPISTKDTIEISNAIRGKPVARAKAILNDVISEKVPIKYRRFTNGVGHKPGIGSGRCPVNASKSILKILNSAEANAQVAGLDVKMLIIQAIIPNRASRGYHFGRHRGMQTKSTNVEIVLGEKQ